MDIISRIKNTLFPAKPEEIAYKADLQARMDVPQTKKFRDITYTLHGTYSPDAAPKQTTELISAEKLVHPERGVDIDGNDIYHVYVADVTNRHLRGTGIPVYKQFGKARYKKITYFYIDESERADQFASDWEKKGFTIKVIYGFEKNVKNVVSKSKSKGSKNDIRITISKE
jgi:hypothetical protein